MDMASTPRAGSRPFIRAATGPPDIFTGVKTEKVASPDDSFKLLRIPINSLQGAEKDRVKLGNGVFRGES